MGFFKQKSRIGLPFPCPGDLPDPGVEYGSPASQADSLSSEPPGNDHKVLLLNSSQVQWAAKALELEACLLF